MFRGRLLMKRREAIIAKKEDLRGCIDKVELG